MLHENQKRRYSLRLSPVKIKTKTGKVLAVNTKKNTVIVEGMQHGYKAHKAQRSEPAGRHRASGRVRIDISNVMLCCMTARLPESALR